MSDKRRGLGKGLGALIPSGPHSIPNNERPVDLLFRDRPAGGVSLDVQVGSHNPLFPPASSSVAVEEITPVHDLREQLPGSDGLTDHPATHPDLVDQDVDPPSWVEPDQSASGNDHEVARLVSRETSPSDPDVASVDGSSDTGGRAELVNVPGARFAQLPVEAIRANPRQPRSAFDDDAAAELTQSIEQVGVLQPVVVRELPEEAGYELVMGERRWRACLAAGVERIPAIIRDTSDDELLRDALLENLHRSDLNPLEEAAAYDQLLTDFGCTHDELARRIGRSRPQISNTIRLLRLPALVQRRVAAGVLSSGHARALLSLADPAAMERLAQRIVAEGISVRATEEIVALGEAEEVAPRQRRVTTRLHGEALDAITSKLSDVLETRVSAAMSRRKGRLTIEFADLEDLDRILGDLALRRRDDDRRTTTSEAAG